MPFVHEENQFVRKRGNRREVLDGVCYCTSGGLTADCLEEKGGKIISKKRSKMGRERYATKNPFKSDEKEGKDEQPSEEDEKVEKVEKIEKKKAAPVKKKTASRQIRVPVARRRRGRARRGRRV